MLYPAVLLGSGIWISAQHVSRYFLQEEQSALLASFSNYRVCRAFALTRLTLALRLCAPDSCCATGYGSMHARLCTVLSAQAAFAVGPSGVLEITFGLLNYLSRTLRGCWGP
jgi:hypothetical protein